MSRLSSKIPPNVKRKLRSLSKRCKRLLVNAFLSYDRKALLYSLRSLGIQEGDSVMVHSTFDLGNGFRGTIHDVISTFLDAVGATGNLLMLSLPYRSSTLEYLKALKRFDVRNTPSAMGLMSELFRARSDVLRSLHPSHPVLARGPKAEWIVADHEKCLYPCGPGTPFEKLLSLGGKVVLFDVPFAYFTFFHCLEHRVREHLNFALYHQPPFDIPVIDASGRELMVRTHAFSVETLKRRRIAILESELRSRKILCRRRVGNTQILCVDLRDVLGCAEDMTRRGVFFYELSQQSPLSRPDQDNFERPSMEPK